MKILPYVTIAMIAILAPSVAHSQMMSDDAYGAGPHGYDWMVGTWSCTNPNPSKTSGPAHQTQTVTKANGGAILFHITGANMDYSNYDVYVASKKMWVSPVSGADGTYGNESTSDTGKRIVWVGSTFFPDSGKTMPTRDTFANSANKFTDLGETNSGGVWKTAYKITCTKT